MQVNTTRFGTLEVAEENLLYFPEGMVGFSHLKKYFFVPVTNNDVFAWMQSQSDPDTAFLMVDPFIFFPDYDVQLNESVCASLQIKDREEVTLLTVVTIPPQEGVRGMTTNLLAPVVINHVKGIGRQVILDGSGYKTKHLLFSHVLQKSRNRACG
ncbi:MAG: flagellar assembly protein FliW [Syntrophomonadaceae bacterium]|jgi:flagellar assembly factor FliW|nr:flagellar assembly protein FliW [Thermoanaerobacterales bacterium]NLN21667.1 flagellar assembly protein FliW [Syntrophomonadaceae bacterium]HAF16781.1 flagellar assembly protein FliW [Peptococcaceae bacterium]